VIQALLLIIIITLGCMIWWQTRTLAVLKSTLKDDLSMKSNLVDKRLRELHDANMMMTQAANRAFINMAQAQEAMRQLSNTPIDRSAWVEDVAAAPEVWELGDDGEIISHE